MSQTKTELVDDQLHVDLAFDAFIIDFPIGWPAFRQTALTIEEHEASSN